MRKLIITLFLILLILPGNGVSETAAYPSLPIGGSAPYAPVAEAYSDDGLSYDDGTLSIRIEIDFAFGVNIYYIYVQLTDPSQFRTALASPYPSKVPRNVKMQAEQNNAVLALNGDYFIYHNEGYIVRGGKLLRDRPNYTRDLLIIDENADLKIIPTPYRYKIEAFQGEIREAFSFGPALIIDYEVQTFKYAEKVSCGYPTKDQRLVICQFDSLSYLFVMTDGCDQDGEGLTGPELMQLLVAKNVRHAYNLDGGNSCTLIMNGDKINTPDNPKMRDVGDIIYFATLIPDGSGQ
ncbi:MAG: phosphodiester glycosidase family protein [Clostridiales bacterium]|nr:phosphodiester glycosidase family protein [Clostridiales bacterium]